MMPVIGVEGMWNVFLLHYSDVKMGTMASQITHVSIACSAVCSGTYCEGNPSVIGGFLSQRASNAEMFPFDDVIMVTRVTTWRRAFAV